MFDENNPIRPQDPEIRSQDPETPAETPAVPQRVLPRAENPEWEEPEEIVSWYTLRSLRAGRWSITMSSAPPCPRASGSRPPKRKSTAAACGCGSPWRWWQ